MPECLTERPVALQMPFPAHGLSACLVSFGVDQNPGPTTRRFRARSGVVLFQAPGKVGGPADVGARVVVGVGADDVDEAVHGW